MIRVKPECVELVMEKTAVGDWFLLYLLGQNIDHIVFKVTNYNQSSASSAWMITLWTVNQEKLYGATFFQDVFHELAKKLGYRSKDMTDP